MLKFWKVKGKSDFVTLTIAALIPVLIGAISGYFASGSAAVYKNLRQPSFAPPGWIFGPVWTSLYILMGIASYRVYMHYKQNNSSLKPLIFYAVQLVFNFFWTLIFFRFGLRGYAFFELLILWILILITLKLFFSEDKFSGYLLIPYILWVSFAGVLNYSVWILNK